MELNYDIIMGKCSNMLVREFAILLYTKEHPGSNMVDASKALGLSLGETSNYVTHLLEMGLIHTNEEGEIIPII